MKTIQHTLAYVLSCKEYNEDDIRRMVPYVLLPDAIRCFTGPRQYSHFERARNEDDSSWMTFPADMKHLSKEAFICAGQIHAFLARRPISLRS